MTQLDPVGWFRSAHPEQGSLRVQVSSGRGLFPVSDAQVEVYRDFGAVRETFYSGATDASGIAERILLPALPAAWGRSADTAGISGTSYSVAVRHPQFGEQHRQVLVFPRVESLLPVSLAPSEQEA